MPYHSRDPKRDHNFDNHPYGVVWGIYYEGAGGVLGGTVSSEVMENQARSEMEN